MNTTERTAPKENNMRPEYQSPAGASIEIRRSRFDHAVIVTFDRLAIGGASSEQCQAVARLARSEIAATVKPNRSVTYLSDPTLWTIPTTRDRELGVIRQLIEIEEHA